MDRNKRPDATKTVGVVILAICMLAIGFTAGKLIDINLETSLRNITSEKPLGSILDRMGFYGVRIC